MHRFAAPYRYNLRRLWDGDGAFILDRIAQSWRGWWWDPRARVMRRRGPGDRGLPVLAAVAATQGALQAQTALGP
jgi:hypothetical protein